MRPQLVEPGESQTINRRILRWLTVSHDIGDAQDMASELGLKRDAFYQRVSRLKKKGAAQCR